MFEKLKERYRLAKLPSWEVDMEELDKRLKSARNGELMSALISLVFLIGCTLVIIILLDLLPDFITTKQGMLIALGIVTVVTLQFFSLLFLCYTIQTMEERMNCLYYSMIKFHRIKSGEKTNIKGCEKGEKR